MSTCVASIWDPKAYCDKELSESKTTKGEKEYEITKLSTKIDQMSAQQIASHGSVFSTSQFLTISKVLSNSWFLGYQRRFSVTWALSRTIGVASASH